MCGRAHIPGETQFLKAFDFPRWIREQADLSEAFAESFNFAPTQSLPVVVFKDNERQALMMRWGLIPFFAKGVAGKYSTINARRETMETSASYRAPWKRGQRCIFPAVGFYEWHTRDDGTKQPYYIHCADQEVFGMAALWDASTTAEGFTVLSCTIVTMDANPLMASIHNTNKRMPAILRRDQHEAWLRGSLDEARACINQYPQESMRAWEVSTKVNSPRNNSPDLLKAVGEL